MRVGINYPWVDYGWDFGPPPEAWVPPERAADWRASRRERVAEDFRAFAAQGFFAVRWFLLGDGLNYGTGECAPRLEGGEWIFDPLPPEHPFHPRLLDDFAFVLDLCRSSGLKLFPVLLDCSWCFRGTPVGARPEIVKGGRSGVIRDPARREAFLDRVLEPLLDLSLRRRGSIYAWEVMNEPEWAVRGFWRRGRRRTTGLGGMKGFLAEGARRIALRRLEDGRPAFRSSVGFAHWDTLERWDAAGLGLTLPQFHYYAQGGRPLPEAVGARVVGEFASAEERAWPDLRLRRQAQTLTNRLECVERKGYPECFVWSARAVDRATRWTEVERREFAAYSRGSIRALSGDADPPASTG